MGAGGPSLSTSEDRRRIRPPPFGHAIAASNLPAKAVLISTFRCHLVASIWGALAAAIYDGKATKRRIDASIVSKETGFCQISSQTGGPKVISCSAVASTTGIPANFGSRFS